MGDQLAARQTLEGQTFVSKQGKMETRQLPQDLQALVEYLVVDPKDVISHWHEWQLNMVCAMLGSDSGDRVTQSDTRGRSPLHYAAAVGNAHPVDFLLKRGADLGAQDDL